MAQGIVTFKDIVDAISEAIGVQKDDLNARNKIKRFVNMYYIDEVLPFKRWTWTQGSVPLVHEAYYNVGTISVTPDSETITFNTAPNPSEGSFKNYRFAVDGSNKVYTIEAHTAGSTSATLTGKYLESLNATASYKIWRDTVALPTDAKETVEIWHAERPKPLEAVGPQGIRKFEASDPKKEGFPYAYNTTDFYDPSDEDGEFEEDRYRQIRVYPSITPTPVTLNVDYVKEVSELSDDNDEPILPVSDRIVIVYGAGAMAWSVISRNEEMHDKWMLKANAKLARMAGEIQDGFDQPSLKPKSGYVNSIRRSGLRRGTRVLGGGGGQSAVSLPSYLKDVRIDGATLIDDMDVDPGVLIDGRDVSADGAVLDNLSSAVAVALADATAGQVVASFPYAEEDTVHFQYSIRRGSSREAGLVTVITDGSTAALAQGAIAEIGDCGVTVTADVVAGNIRLIADTTSTGQTAQFSYRQFHWLS